MQNFGMLIFMPNDSQNSSRPEGLRARKQRQTRQRIADVALRLFLEHGFEATTLDAIAASADISRRTFFHYFASKEAIVFALESDTEQLFRTVLAASTNDLQPLNAVRQALSVIISRYQTEEARSIDRLMRSTEALRARKQANYARQETALYNALSEKWPAPDRQPGLRLLAMVGIGAMRLAADCWHDDKGQRPLQNYLEEAFQRLRAEFDL
jgi:AcrR family transcriptional regulator